MSADDLLTRAASRLWELAEAATPGPWEDAPPDGDVWGPGNRDRICRTSAYRWEQDAAFIAAMSPDVALALADWLEHEADAYEQHRASATTRSPRVAHALRVACAVLREDT